MKNTLMFTKLLVPQQLLGDKSKKCTLGPCLLTLSSQSELCFDARTPIRCNLSSNPPQR